MGRADDLHDPQARTFPSRTGPTADCLGFAGLFFAGALAASDPPRQRTRRGIDGTISLSASWLWLPDSGTVSEQMLLFHKCREGGVGQVACRADSRRCDGGDENGNGRGFQRQGKLLSNIRGGENRRRGIADLKAARS
jgi:hypothetical protein